MSKIISLSIQILNFIFIQPLMLLYKPSNVFCARFLTSRRHKTQKNIIGCIGCKKRTLFNFLQNDIKNYWVSSTKNIPSIILRKNTKPNKTTNLLYNIQQTSFITLYSYETNEKSQNPNNLYSGYRNIINFLFEVWREHFGII